jgi:hypothetical protein
MFFTEFFARRRQTAIGNKPWQPHQVNGIWNILKKYLKFSIIWFLPMNQKTCFSSDIGTSFPAKQ